VNTTEQHISVRRGSEFEITFTIEALGVEYSEGVSIKVNQGAGLACLTGDDIGLGSIAPESKRKIKLSFQARERGYLDHQFSTLFLECRHGRYNTGSYCWFREPAFRWAN